MNWKSGRLLLVLVFILQISLAQARTRLCRSDDNPFISSLIRGGVRMHRTSVLDAGTCGEEWKVHGTCCEAESLKRYALEEMNDYREAAKNFKAEVENLVTLASWFHLGNIHRHSQKVKQEKSGVAASQTAEYAELQKQKSRLESITQSLEKHETDLEQSGDSCIEKLLRARTSAMCSTCSSRSAVFFRSSKALMSIEDCKDIIGVCHGYWRAIVNLVSRLGSISDQISGLKASLENSKHMHLFKTESIDFLKDWIDEIKIQQKLRSCKSPDTCDSRTAKEICSALITIDSPNPITVGPTPFLKLKVTSAKKSQEWQAAARKSQQSEKKPAASSKRLLYESFMFPGSQIFNSDIDVVKHSEYLEGKVPMNFNILFP